MSEQDAGGAGADAGGGAGAVAAPANFTEAVPVEYRESITKAGIKDVGALAKNWHDAQSAIGSMVRIPGPDAGAEDLQRFDSRLMDKVPGLVRIPADGDAEGWKTFNARMGVPEVPTGYQFKVPEGIPEEVAKSLDDWFAPIAHKAALPAGAAAAVRGAWLDSIKASATASQAAQEAAADALRQEWGGAYDQRMQSVMKFIETFGGADGAQLVRGELDASGLGNNPMLAKTLEKAARLLGEDTVVRGRSDTGLLPTLDDLNTQIAEIRNNRAHPFHDPNKPGHQEAVNKVNRLYEQKAALQGNAA